MAECGMMYKLLIFFSVDHQNNAIRKRNTLVAASYSMDALAPQVELGVLSRLFSKYQSVFEPKPLEIY